MNLSGTTWHIDDVDDTGVVDRSMITMQFEAGGRVAGNTGCNRYFGSVSLDADRLSFSQLGSTRRACVPALMNQEQRFLEALQSVTSYRIDEREILLLLDGNGARRLRGARIQADPTADVGFGNEPQDRAPGSLTQFDCGSAGTIELRFLGPETVQIMRNGMATVLQRVRSASGARYAGDGMEFWNQGDEAMLEIDGERVSCRRTS